MLRHLQVERLEVFKIREFKLQQFKVMKIHQTSQTTVTLNSLVQETINLVELSLSERLVRPLPCQPLKRQLVVQL